RAGGVGGGGLEYGLKAHGTNKGEQDKVVRENGSSAAPPPIQLNRNVQMVKFGLNYKLESGVSDAVEQTRAAARSAKPADEDLAKQSQNPIADMVSLPFQSNTNFNAGPFKRTQEVLNIQPVVPLHISADWNLISRTIIPVISQPDPIFNSNTSGIGDVTQSFFFSPTHPGQLIWGVGPVFTVPSATDPILGQGKVLLGPTVVL